MDTLIPFPSAERRAILARLEQDPALHARVGAYLVQARRRGVRPAEALAQLLGAWADEPRRIDVELPPLGRAGCVLVLHYPDGSTDEVWHQPDGDTW
jgi:hypothetical protein